MGNVVVTDEEMARLNELGKKYAASGKCESSLTKEEWDWVAMMADKLIESHKQPT